MTRTHQRPCSLLVVATLFALMGTLFVTTAQAALACSSSGAPAVTTDRADYAPGESVQISGTGFGCAAGLTVTVTEPTATTTSIAVTADATDGTFTTTYQIPSEDAGGKYIVEVRDPGGTVLASTEFYDSHFRFGHLFYTKTGPTSAAFTLRNAFRRDGYGCINAPSTSGKPCTGPGGRPGVGDYIVENIGATEIFFGDGASTPTLQYRVDAIDVLGNWLLATALSPGTTNPTIPHIYPGAGPYTARIDSSARTSSEVNNAGGAYRVVTVVNLAGTNSDSPQSSLPAIVDCVRNSVCSFPIPAADANSATNSLRFRLSTAAEAGSGFDQPGPPFAPNAATVNNTTGQYTWNTTGASEPSGRNLYSTQVTIEERDSSNVLVSSSAIDFLIRLVTGNPPVFDVPPTPAANSAIAANAGSPVSFTVQASDVDTAQAVSVGSLGLPAGAALSCPLSPTNPRSCSFSWTPTAAQAGNHIITFTAQDPTGLNASPHSVTIQVSAANQPPVVDAGGDGSGGEGSPITLGGSASDADGPSLTTGWTYSTVSGVDTGASCTFADPSAPATTITCTDDGVYRATLTASDTVSTVVDDADITVSNATPTVNITAPSDGALYAITSPVNLSAAFGDAGRNDTHACTVNWDDGGVEAGTVSQSPGSGTCTKSRTYAAAGVYTIQMAVTDDDGASATDTVMVVVYDPSAGFVTGGGWIDSPAGAYMADPTLVGRANFGFVSKYQKGATTPTGQTEFQFQAAGLSFHSTSYEWLVVSGPKAQYKGLGTVNGVSGYSFLLTITDGQVTGGGGVDKFRLRITGPSGVVYDNVPGSSDLTLAGSNPQAISGGSIIIHAGKK